MDYLEKDSIDFFVDSSREYFQFLIEARQWSGFGLKELNDWISNFSFMDNGEYIACRILNESLGYSEEDIIIMLKGLIVDILNKEIVNNMQINSGFNLIKSTLEYALKEELDKTLFVPLLVDDSPGESGDGIIRLMKQRIGFQFHKSFHFMIEEKEEYNRIIILDDCIGSGEQFTRFWTYSTISTKESFRNWCLKKSIKVYYVVLVGYKDTVEQLEKEYTDCSFICAETISNEYRVMSVLKNDQIFFSQRELFECTLQENDIELYGFNDMDFAVFISNNIPDWSLPILHKERDNWKPLLRRKDSSV